MSKSEDWTSWQMDDPAQCQGGPDHLFSITDEEMSSDPELASLLATSITMPPQDVQSSAKGSCWRFSCTTCNADFRSNAELEEHGKKANHLAFVCTVPGCGKAYTRRDSLSRHQSSHANRGLTCKFCGDDVQKFYARKDHLVSHIKRMHPYEKFNLQDVLRGCSTPHRQESLSSHSSPRTINYAMRDDQSQVSDDEEMEMRRGLKYVGGALRSLAGHPASLGQVEDQIDSMSYKELKNLREQLIWTVWTMNDRQQRR